MSVALGTVKRFRQGAGTEGSCVLYLVTPTGLQWTGDVGQEVVDIAREHGKDLGEIEGWWAPTEARMNDDHVRAALRWGVASARGIVVAARYTVTLQRPHELAALIAETEPRLRAYRAHPQVKMVDAFMESQSPGWTAQSEELDANVDRSMRDSLAEAREEAAEELASASVNSALRAHWVRLGGLVPRPE
jgi:hypothetical protein